MHLETRCNAVGQRIRLLQRLRHGDASVTEEQRRAVLFDADLIAKDPAYGRAVCHCERVSEGEIRDAMVSSLPPAELGGLRRRTRAMNGRCQGFYCAGSVERLFGEAATSEDGGDR